MARVSPTAVSFILNDKAAGKISAGKQRAVKELIRRHGYKQNRAAQALIMRRTYCVAVCYAGSLEATPWIGNASYHLLINSIASRLQARDYGVNLIEADTRPSLKAAGERLLAHRCDGFLMLNYEPRALAKLASLMGQHGLRLVSVGTALPGGEADWVAVDRNASFEKLVRHALEQGCKRPGFLDTDMSKKYSALKRDIFKRVMVEHNMDSSATAVLDIFDVKSVRRVVGKFIASHPQMDGIIMTDNGVAAMVQMCLDKHPARLFGFGDEIFVSFCNPPITYMKLPMARLAQAAVEHLLDRIESSAAPPLRRSMLCELVN